LAKDWTHSLKSNPDQETYFSILSFSFVFLSPEDSAKINLMVNQEVFQRILHWMNPAQKSKFTPSKFEVQIGESLIIHSGSTSLFLSGFDRKN